MSTFSNLRHTFSSLWNKFAKSKKYREQFTVSYLKRSIPFQISELRNKRGWSQEQLAEAAKVTQGVISRAENPNYGNLTFNTALRIAAGLDVAFVGEFVSFSELARRVEYMSERTAQIVAFEKDSPPREQTNDAFREAIERCLSYTKIALTHSGQFLELRPTQQEMSNEILIHKFRRQKGRSDLEKLLVSPPMQ